METKFHSISLLDRDCIWHPFTQMGKRDAIPIVRANGVYLYGEDGRAYLDGISSWWVNLHGHSHPYIANKIQAQLEVLEHVIFADFTHEPAVTLASRLLPLLPGSMSKIFYTDNGSTAVEAALKMALQYWYNRNISKKKIICFKGSYHGDTFGAMAASGKNEFNRPFWSHLFEVIAIDPPLEGREDRSLQQLKNAIDTSDAACFIFEPLILGSGGMIVYQGQGLNRLMQYCKQHDVLTISDEVMTGFGRTGTLFAGDQIERKPDMICLSKGLTGGFLPLGAVACAEDIFNAFLGEKKHVFLHGHSYTANPLSCVSALASLDLVLEPSCVNQREMIAASHRAFVKKWCFHPRLKRCESIGTILALEYQAEVSSYFHSIRDTLYQFFLDRGILLRPLGNVLYVMPPYCITAEQLQGVYEHIIFTLEGVV